MVTCTEMRLSTSTLPLRSTMRPRGASTGTTRIRLACAATWYCSDAMTCRYQSRENSAANSANTTMPSTDMRTRGDSAAITGTPPAPGGSWWTRWPTASRAPRRELAIVFSTPTITAMRSSENPIRSSPSTVPNTPYRMTPTMLAAVAVATGIHHAARRTESWRLPTR